jgi:hypothetical protein
VFFEKRKEGIVAVRIALLENMLEIAGRLVGVDDEYEVERVIGLAHEAHTV